MAMAPCHQARGTLQEEREGAGGARNLCPDMTHLVPFLWLTPVPQPRVMAGCSSWEKAPQGPWLCKGTSIGPVSKKQGQAGCWGLSRHLLCTHLLCPGGQLVLDSQPRALPSA